MRAGLLDEVIKILRPQVTINEYGEKDQKYVEIAQTKANVVHENGNRAIENDEILHNYQKRIEVWSYNDIADTDWIEYDGKNYRILSIELLKKQLKKVLVVELIND